MLTPRSLTAKSRQERLFQRAQPAFDVVTLQPERELPRPQPVAQSRSRSRSMGSFPGKVGVNRCSAGTPGSVLSARSHFETLDRVSHDELSNGVFSGLRN